MQRSLTNSRLPPQMPLSQGPCLLSRLWLTNLGSQAPQELPRYDLKQAAVLRAQGKTEERGSHSRTEGGRFSKQGNLHTRVVLGSRKMSVSLTGLPHLKVYVEALTGFSHIFHPDGTSLSQGCGLGVASRSREGKRHPHSKDRSVKSL